MPNKSQKNLLNKAIDVASLGHSSVFDLGTLFQAIRKDSEENSTAYSLAGIGMYLSEDWANLINSECEELKKIEETDDFSTQSDGGIISPSMGSRGGCHD